MANPWYKRMPRAILDAKRAGAKLTITQAAVYDIVLDLIYEGDGETPNDAEYVAIHLRDLTAEMAAQAIADLTEMGKLQIDGDVITNPLALALIEHGKTHGKTDSKTIAKIRSKNGKKGAFARWKKHRENNDLMANDGKNDGKKWPRIDKIREEQNGKKPPPSGSSKKPDEADSKPTPAKQIIETLMTVVDEETAKEIVKHREALKAKLTPRAAKLMAGKLSKSPTTPQDGADLMIERGWRGYEPEWHRNTINAGGQQNGQYRGGPHVAGRQDAKASGGGKTRDSTRGRGFFEILGSDDHD